MGEHRPDANAGRRDRGPEGSLQDLRTYVVAAVTGMLSPNGFVWLVTDALGRLGVIATYCAGALLASERRQTFSPDKSTELGGMYVPRTPPQPQPRPQYNRRRPHRA